MVGLQAKGTTISRSNGEAWWRLGQRGEWSNFRPRFRIAGSTSASLNVDFIALWKPYAKIQRG
jgi:hypothetical protein